jgi:2-methylcitrate dehydratase
MSRKPDVVLSRIADYVHGHRITSALAYEMAGYSLLDSIACALESQGDEDCARLLGPVVPGATLSGGARVPGTRYRLEPVKAAFDISTSVRWLEHSDTWFGVDGGHPSDNMGAILAVADYISRSNPARRLRVKDVLTAIIKAYEIHGILYLTNNFLALGLDSTAPITVASAAVATGLLGGSRDQILNATSNAWLDGVTPRLYRIGHNAGPRKSWAAGDSTSRGVMHALSATRGEPGYPFALTAPKWGLNDAIMRGNAISLSRPLGSYVSERILFKLLFPSQFHTQTPCECATRLYPLVRERIDDIREIKILTHEKTLTSAFKEGPLHNAASRDHCVQYVVAVVLLNGRLTTRDYSDAAASDPRIDALRSKTTVTEEKAFTCAFYDPRKRANPSSIQITFRDGKSTPQVRIDYPLGHPRRREEGLPLVREKFRASVAERFPSPRQKRIFEACSSPARLSRMFVSEFMSLFAL